MGRHSRHLAQPSHRRGEADDARDGQPLSFHLSLYLAGEVFQPRRLPEKKPEMIPIPRDNREGGAACSRSIGAAPPGMMAVQQRGPTVWEMCRLLSGNGITNSFTEDHGLRRISSKLQSRTSGLPMVSSTSCSSASKEISR